MTKAKYYMATRACPAKGLMHDHSNSKRTPIKLPLSSEGFQSDLSALMAWGLGRLWFGDDAFQLKTRPSSHPKLKYRDC